MEFKQFIIENWEYIAAGLGLGGAGLGAQKGVKAYQKAKDKGQDSRIRKNADDILALQNDVKEVKSKQDFIIGALDKNTEDDMHRYDILQTTVKDTNESVKELTGLFNTFARDTRKEILDIIKDLYKK